MPKPKLKTIMIFAIGYILGARAGRKRYDQIKGLTLVLGAKPRRIRRKKEN